MCDDHSTDLSQNLSSTLLLVVMPVGFYTLFVCCRVPVPGTDSSGVVIFAVKSNVHVDVVFRAPRHIMASPPELEEEQRLLREEQEAGEGQQQQQR